jgi:hypothetical protein
MVIVKVKIANPKAVRSELWTDLNSYYASHGKPLEVEDSAAGMFVYVPLSLSAYYRGKYGLPPLYSSEEES